MVFIKTLVTPEIRTFLTSGQTSCADLMRRAVDAASGCEGGRVNVLSPPAETLTQLREVGYLLNDAVRSWHESLYLSGDLVECFYRVEKLILGVDVVETVRAVSGGIRDVQVKFGVAQETHALYRDLATRCGMSLSAWIFDAVCGFYRLPIERVIDPVSQEYLVLCSRVFGLLGQVDFAEWDERIFGLRKRVVEQGKMFRSTPTVSVGNVG